MVPLMDGCSRLLLLPIQFMYLMMYVAFLLLLESPHPVLLFQGLHAAPNVARYIILILSCGVAFRLYLLVMFVFPQKGLRRVFARIFPAMLVLDELWAFSPLLWFDKLGAVALLGVPALALLPFGQRWLISRGYEAPEEGSHKTEARLRILTGEKIPGLELRTGLHPQLVEANVDFGLCLHRELAREQPGANLVLSPISIGLTLAMAANGARGQTRASMARVLGTENIEKQEGNRAYGEILEALRILDKKVELRLCNSLWADDAYPVRPEFVTESKKYFDAEVFNVSFGSAGTAPRINRWVSERTAGKIPRIIGGTSNQDQLVLLNATYFLGRWQFPFDPDKTRERTFHAASGPRKHPMMHQEAGYPYLETDPFQAVALPYGFPGIAMYVFLPRKRYGLARLLEDVNAAHWREWMEGFSYQPGEIVVPRFRVECGRELIPALQAMGMNEPFDPGRADFSGMFLGDVTSFGNRVVHETFLDVDEKGTEAAAVTGFLVARGRGVSPPSPFRMVVDRPFFLAIRDELSGVLLFTGSVWEP